jgi:hypothetical protein
MYDRPVLGFLLVAPMVLRRLGRYLTCVAVFMAFDDFCHRVFKHRESRCMWLKRSSSSRGFDEAKINIFRDFVAAGGRSRLHSSCW